MRPTAVAEPPPLRGDHVGVQRSSRLGRRNLGPHIGRPPCLLGHRADLRRQDLGRIIDAQTHAAERHPGDPQRPPPVSDGLLIHAPVVGHRNYGFQPDGTDQIAAQDRRNWPLPPRTRRLYRRIGNRTNRDLSSAIFTRQLVADPALRGHIRTVQQLEPLGVDHGRARRA